jgi:hypothetical protein
VPLGTGRTTLSTIFSRIPEGGWKPPTGCPDLRENYLSFFLPFSHCGVGPSGPASSVREQTRRLSTPPVGVKGRFRPLHLAVKTGLVLSPISEVFRANADGAHGNRQTSGIQCRILLSSSWTVSHTIHPQDSALMHCCTTGTLLQLSLKSYHRVFRIMNSSSSVAKTWTLHSEKSSLPSEAHDASFGPDDTISRWCIGWRTNLEANTEVPSGPFEVLPVIHFSRFS